MTQKVKMHAKNIDNQYVQVFPETVASQVIVEATGQTLEQMVKDGNLGGSGGIGKIDRKEFVVTATTNGQTEFPFRDAGFDAVNHHVEVHLNGEFLHKGEEYTVAQGGQNVPNRVILTQGVIVGDKVHVSVEKITGGSVGTTPLTDEQASTLEKITSYNNIYIDPVNGSDTSDVTGLESKPFKTMRAASEYINSKSFMLGRLQVILNGGTYVNDVLTIQYARSIVIATNNGDVILEGTPKNPIYNTFANMLFDRTEDVAIGGNPDHKIIIRPNATETDNTAAMYPIYFTNVSRGFVSNNVEIDGINYDPTKTYHTAAKFGIIVGYSSNVEVRATLKNLTIPVRATNNSRATLHQTTIEGGEVHSLLGSTVSTSSAQVIANVPFKKDESSVIFNELNAGIIVESGVNENGKYTKFANGLMLCEMLKNLTLVSDTTERVIYPMSFVGEVSIYASPKNHSWENTQVANNLIWSESHKICAFNFLGNSCYIHAKGLTATITPTLTITAIGRWK